ncbi:MAG: dockerin type I repeat-containing protein [Chloroflexi bacterium]|nr:dockerin type I repeat-containing protein [Chloroflexota bacterium]
MKSGAECDADTCRVELGASFTLSVDIVRPPANYSQISSFIVFGPDLAYKPTDTARDEFVWAECAAASLPVRDQLEAVPNSVLHSCTSSLLPPYPLRDIDNFVDLSMTCSNAESSTLVELLQFGEDPAGDSGALFKRWDQSQVIPKATDLTVICGSGALPPGEPTPTSSPTPDSGNAEMRLVVKEGGACDGDTCTIPQGASFTLAVEIVGIPDQGYILAQTSIFIGADLDYQPADLWTDEYVSPDCVPSVRLADSSPEGTLEHGCLTGLLPPLPVSTYVGNFIELKMNCPDADSTTELRMLPFGDPVALTNGTLFKLSDNSNVVPKLSNLTVICGSGQGPTNTPRPPTETPSPPTPTPDRFVTGDANCDGAVDAIDAALILHSEAGLVRAVACRAEADVNGDGLVNSLDAVLILQFAADLIPQLPAGNTR